MKQVNDQPSGNLPFLKPDDIQYFDKLLVSHMYNSDIPCTILRYLKKKKNYFYYYFSN